MRDPPGILSMPPQRGCTRYFRLVVRMALSVYLAITLRIAPHLPPEPSLYSQDCLTAITNKSQNWFWFFVQVTINEDSRQLASHAVVQGPSLWALGLDHLLEPLKSLLDPQNPDIRWKKARRRVFWAQPRSSEITSTYFLSARTQSHGHTHCKAVWEV